MRDAEASLMNSPGHRASILDPDHTIGVGIGNNTQPATYVSQEFLNRYVALDPLLRQAGSATRWT